MPHYYGQTWSTIDTVPGTMSDGTNTSMYIELNSNASLIYWAETTNSHESLLYAPTGSSGIRTYPLNENIAYFTVPFASARVIVEYDLHRLLIRIRMLASVNSRQYEQSIALNKETLVCEVNLEDHFRQVLEKMKREVMLMAICDNKESWENWISAGNSENTWLQWSIDDSDLRHLTNSRSVEEFKANKEKAERERIEEETKRKLAAELQAKKRVEASARAEQLLKEVIGEVDFTEYKKTGSVSVKTASGREYRLKKDGFARNVEVYEKGQYKHRLCAHLADTDIPIEDNLVAQVLMLRNAESEFLKLANVS